MKLKKKIRKGETGSVKINPDILYRAKERCRKKGILLYAYVSLALQNQLDNDAEEGNATL
jgi:hypothetical protein